MVVLAALLLVGCGVATDETVQRADPDTVPFGLLEEDPGTALSPPQATDVAEVHLYDADEGVVRPVRRAVASGTLADVISQLEEGPTAAEGQAGLSSALDGTTAVGAVRQDGRVAVIDLGAQFTELAGADQLVAIAQLVFTATGQPGVDRVSFTLEGEDVQVPTGDGSVTGDTLTRADFRGLVPSS